MGALSLLEELGDEILSALVEAFALEQLSVAENRGERIVEFVGYSGNELADGGHLLALQKLFLGAPQIFVSFAGLFVETDFLDCGGQLPADRDQQVFFAGGIFVQGVVAEAHDSDGRILAPEEHPHPGAIVAGTDEVRDGASEMRQILGGDYFGARAHDQITKALGKTDLRRA